MVPERRASATEYENLPTQFRIDGGGFGHGIGMSQYGAKGHADAGRTAHDILRTYYRAAYVGSSPPALLRVGLQQGASRMTVSSAGGLAGSNGTLEFRWPGGSALV